MSTLSQAFDEEYVAGFCEIYEQNIVFNREIQMKISSVEPGWVSAEVVLAGGVGGRIGGRRLNGGRYLWPSMP